MDPFVGMNLWLSVPSLFLAPANTVHVWYRSRRPLLGGVGTTDRVGPRANIGASLQCNTDIMSRKTWHMYHHQVDITVTLLSVVHVIRNAHTHTVWCRPKATNPMHRNQNSEAVCSQFCDHFSCWTLSLWINFHHLASWRKVYHTTSLCNRCSEYRRSKPLGQRKNPVRSEEDSGLQCDINDYHT